MRLIVILCGTLLVASSALYAPNILSSKSYQQVQEYQKKIADALIPISKQYPLSKSSIYSVLDYVNSICQICKSNTDEQTSWQDKYQSEATSHASLKENLTQIKQQLSDAQQKLSESQATIQSQASRLQETVSERDLALHEAHNSTVQAQTMATQMKVIQESLGQQRDMPGKQTNTLTDDRTKEYARSLP